MSWEVSQLTSQCSNSNLECYSAKEMLHTSGIFSIDPFTPLECETSGDKLVHTSPDDCILVFDSFGGYKHLFTASNSNMT